MSTLNIVEVNNNYIYQGPRFIRLGPDSGEEFREKYLIPWLENNKNDTELFVDFNGTELYMPSFLEESFGGAIRKGFDVVKKIQFLNMPNDRKKQLQKYIRDAKRAK